MFNLFGEVRAEIRQSIRESPIWIRLSFRRIQKSFRRTYLGPWWFSLEQFLFLCGFGLIRIFLFGGETVSAFVYVGFGLAGYSFVAGVIGESASILVSTPLLKETGLSILSRVFYGISYEIILLGFRLAPVVLIWFIYGEHSYNNLLLTLAYYPLVIFFALALSILIAPCGARFRDIPPALGVLLRLAMMASPIVWSEDGVANPQLARLLTNFNPLGIAVELVRDPFIGAQTDANRVLVLLVISALLGMLGVMVVGFTRRKVNYWI